MELSDGGYEVILSRNAPHTRQRFTLAHEIAHILAAPPGDESMSCGDAATEDLCNRVAAELLIPGRFIARRGDGRDGRGDLPAAGYPVPVPPSKPRPGASSTSDRPPALLLIWRARDDGKLELSASPRTFGFDAPFENGAVLDGAMPFVRQLMGQGEGPISYGDAPDGRVYTGDYVRLNKCYCSCT